MSDCYHDERWTVVDEWFDISKPGRTTFVQLVICDDCGAEIENRHDLKAALTAATGGGEEAGR